MATCLVGMGANIGDRDASLDTALQQLCARVGRPCVESRRYRTVPAGGPSGQPEFLNSVARLTTDLSPGQTLQALRAIEQQLGRRRDERWGPRSIDLDLLLYDDCVIDLPDLMVPHPRLAFRRFVLRPASEIAADWVDRRTGFTIQELADRLDRVPGHIAVVGGGAAEVARRAARLVRGNLLAYDTFFPARPAAPPETLEYCGAAWRGWKLAASDAAKVIVSDFWIGAVTMAHGPLNEWLESLAAEGMVADCWRYPNLVISVGRPATASEGPPRRDRLHQPRQFPLLDCRGKPEEVILDEIRAAVEAMRP